MTIVLLSLLPALLVLLAWQWRRLRRQENFLMEKRRELSDRQMELKMVRTENKYLQIQLDGSRATVEEWEALESHLDPGELERARQRARGDVPTGLDDEAAAADRLRARMREFD